MASASPQATPAQLRYAARLGWSVDRHGRERWALVLAIWAAAEYWGQHVMTSGERWAQALRAGSIDEWLTSAGSMLAMFVAGAIVVICFSGRSALELQSPALQGPIFAPHKGTTMACAWGSVAVATLILATSLIGAIRAVDASADGLEELWLGWSRRLALIVAILLWVSAQVQERLAYRRLQQAAAQLDPSRT